MVSRECGHGEVDVQHRVAYLELKAIDRKTPMPKKRFSQPTPFFMGVYYPFAIKPLEKKETYVPASRGGWVSRYGCKAGAIDGERL